MLPEKKQKIIEELKTVVKTTQRSAKHLEALIEGIEANCDGTPDFDFTFVQHQKFYREGFKKANGWDSLDELETSIWEKLLSIED